MKSETQRQLALFAENTLTMKGHFKLELIQAKRLAALVYAQKNMRIRCDAIKESHQLMKKSTGPFSSFRSGISLSIAAMLSLEGNQERKFADTISVYNMLKKEKFYASYFLVAAAYQIVAHENREYNKIVERTKAFYDGMKAQQWFQTGEDDYIFAAMLALSDVEVQSGVAQIQKIYQQLKPEFRSGNSVQALAQVLVLGGGSAQVTDRVLVLRETLKRQDIKLDKSATLSSLGVLALVSPDVDTIAEEIHQVREYLRGQKGFGRWSITTQELLLYAAAMVASGYTQNRSDDIVEISISTSITNIIIAQQTAMMVACCSGAAAASN